MLEARKALESATLEWKKADKALKAVQSAIEELKTKRAEAEMNFDGKISIAREQAKTAAIESCALVQSAELEELEKELSELQLEKAGKLEHYAFEKVKGSVIERSPIGETAQALIAELKQEAYDTVSKRFVDKYFDSLGVCRVSEDDFLDALDRLEELRDGFFTQRDSKVNMLLESMSARYNEFEIDPKEGAGGGVVIGIGVAGLALSFLSFPLYAVWMCAAYYQNLKKSWYMKKSLDLLKVVEDNFHIMEKALTRRAMDEFRRKQQEIEDEYGEALDAVRDDVREKTDEISALRQKTDAEFEFDDTGVRASLKAALDEIDYMIAVQRKAGQNAQETSAGLKAKVKKMEDEYTSMLDDRVSQFLNFNRIGDSKFFPSQILLTNTPPLVLFDRMQNSIFFAYDDAEGAVDFIRLLCFQVRTRTAPNAVFTQIWDVTASGAQMSCFMDPKAKEDSKLFVIADSSDEIKAAVGELTAVFQKRMKTIMHMGQDINEYNRDMVKLESVTEPYYLVIVLSPETVLSDESFNRLLVNGASMGIYIYIFADRAKMGDNYLGLLENVKLCCHVTKDKVMSTAQSALAEAIKNRKRV